MTAGRALLVVALVAVAGCTLPIASDSPTTEPAGSTDALQTETGTSTADATTASPTATPVVTPPDETPAASFFADGERVAAITLEVADNRTERSRGLMHRESLERNHGMLFVYDAEGNRTFWMKNTLIPLDMIFVDANGTVLNVEHASVQPNASDDELRRYHSDGPAKYVIEVNRGFANRTGVDSGARVEFHGNETLVTPDG